MNNDKLTLEEFRKIITEQYTEKGVGSPTPGSKEEQFLYQQWLRGQEKLKKFTNKRTGNG